MKNILIALVCLINIEVALSYPKVPKISIAPGHLCSQLSNDFKELRYKERIPYCKRRVSKRKKDQICLLYDIENRKEYTVDHIIPLSIGGSNSDLNLWCQHKKIHTGRMESFLYYQLKKGNIRQVEAIVEVLRRKHDPTGK